MTDTARLEKALGHTFSDKDLLSLSLTHRSVGGRNNERLEFLGDSVVNHIIAEELYRRYPRAREGEMSRMRAALVRGDTLAEVARELQLGDHVQLGRGERKSGGHRRTSILADAFEAVIGAVLLDSGLEACRQCVLKWFAARLEEVGQGDAGKDAKTRLQEYLQGRNCPLPDYALLDVQGDDHDQSFRVACRLSSPELVAEGIGGSRRKAEQQAAARALEQITNHAG